jgi:type II secretory pathway component PulC
VGVNQGQIGQPFAIIEDMQSGTQDIFELDKPVFGGSTLVSVDSKSVTLQSGEELVTLSLKGSGNQEAAAGSQSFSQHRIEKASKEAFSLELTDSELVTDVARSQDGTPVVVLSQELVDQHFQERGSSLISSVNSTRPEPVIENGQMLGIKLSNVEADNFLGQIGLQSGDVVTKINGKQVSSLQEAVSMAEGSSWSDIELMRNGEAVKVGISLAQNQQ